jgi:HK97 gp10 family phage protein
MACKGDLMAKFQFEGIDDYIAQLKKIYEDTDEIIGAAIYQGAGVVMKSVVTAIENLQTDDKFGTPENKTTGPNTYQKEGLRQSIGIAKLRKDGTFWNVKIGFDGYNGLTTKTWPSGQPNAMVARSVESGTSWMQKQPFMRKAESSSRARCEQAMANQIDIEITKRVKES